MGVSDGMLTGVSVAVAVAVAVSVGMAVGVGVSSCSSGSACVVVWLRNTPGSASKIIAVVAMNRNLCVTVNYQCERDTDFLIYQSKAQDRDKSLSVSRTTPYVSALQPKP